jgi:N-acetylglucosamine transport system substrate-binding protein
VAVFGLLAAGLGACGGGEEKDAAKSDAPVAEDPGSAEDNPFGVVAGSEVEALVFDGGYKMLAWVENAGKLAEEKTGMALKVTETTDGNTDLQTRLAAGTAPALANGVSNVGQIASELAELDDLYDSLTYDGDKLSSLLLEGAKKHGTYNGRLVSMPTTVSLFSLWYSASLFEENGWTPPKTWDEMMALGEAAKAKGKYLFAFGKEAAVYWEWAALDCAVKQGGLDVYLNLANLKEGAWSAPAIRQCFEKVKETVDKGYWVPGGAGTQFTQAQASWSLDQEALFYYCGSWIESEMSDATAENFQMTAWPVPVLDPSTAAFPFEAAVLQYGGDEFVIPKSAKNVAGGKELLRAMLSKDPISTFAEAGKVVVPVQGIVPEDGWGSTALRSIADVSVAAGENLLPFTGNWDGGYGIQPLTEWNSFLSGNMTVDELLAELQKQSDGVRADDSIVKIEYTA